MEPSPFRIDRSTPPAKRPWEEPRVVVERSLVARAQDPFLGEVDKDKADPFLGPLSASL